MGPRAQTLVIAAALVLGGAGCKPGKTTDEDGDASTEVDEPAAEPSADIEYEPHCCPLDSPSCDCPHIGGSPDEHGRCATVCNVLPDGWIIRVDDNGCLYWHIPEDAGSCTEEPDPVPDDALEPVAEPLDETEPGPEPAEDADAGA
jgi:hypothetical protein